MSTTHTEERIRKLLDRGLSCAAVARKCGRPGDLERVHRVGCNSNCPPDGSGISFADEYRTQEQADRALDALEGRDWENWEREDD